MLTFIALIGFSQALHFDSNVVISSQAQDLATCLGACDTAYSSPVGNDLNSCYSGCSADGEAISTTITDPLSAGLVGEQCYSWCTRSGELSASSTTTTTTTITTTTANGVQNTFQNANGGATYTHYYATWYFSTALYGSDYFYAITSSNGPGTLTDATTLFLNTGACMLGCENRGIVLTAYCTLPEYTTSDDANCNNGGSGCTLFELDSSTVTCDAGYEGYAGTATCSTDVNSPGEFGGITACSAISCAEDEYVSSNACTACAAGTTAVAGADASGSDTTCNATICAANEYVVNNTCTACAAGYEAVAGADASGSDTTCNATICAANEYVVNNTCTACAAGTTALAGADASGSDTTCNVTYCAEDQYVSSNVCTNCSGTSTNAAGDDASGSDTTCDFDFEGSGAVAFASVFAMLSLLLNAF